MASLLVSVHDTVMNYIKKAKDKDLAGKIGSEDTVKDVIRKPMFEPRRAIMYRSVKPSKIVSREIIRINKLVVRRMKPSPLGKMHWKILFSRYMPTDVFDLPHDYTQLPMAPSLLKKTSPTRTIEIDDQDKVVLLFLNLANINEVVLNGDDLLQAKCLRDGMKCSLIVNSAKPFVIFVIIRRAEN